MRIGIDCRTILNPEAGHAAGVAHYTYHLVRAILRTDTENEFVLFMDKHSERNLRDEFIAMHPRVEIRQLPFHHLKRYLPFAYSHMIIAGAFTKAKLDLLHAPANTVPMFFSGPMIVTVHDLAIYDHPEWFPGMVPGAQTFSKRILVPWALERARKIIAVSEATRNDLVRQFGINGSRVWVIHEGVDTPVTEGWGLESPEHDSVLRHFRVKDGKYVLFVGTIEPRKNIPAAIEAFSAFIGRSGADDIDFLIAGKKGWKYEEVFRAIEAANKVLGSERVRYVGYVNSAEKDALMRHAGAFIFPSLYEGFGLPVIESMAHGVPVICSKEGSLKEVVGDAALTCFPEDTDCMGDALFRTFEDERLRQRLIERGFLRSQAFTWDVAAEKTIRAYSAALSA